MPHKVKRIAKERPFFLIPVALGMAGVLFSTQLEDPILQGVIVLVCLAVPLFVGGNVLARVHSDGLQRILLVASLTGLTLGAVVSVTGLSERLVDFEYVSPAIGELSRQLGIGSLFIGLLAVMYSMVRSEAMIDQVVDRFRNVADHIGEGFLLVGQDGNVVLVNRAVLDSIGVAEEDLVGKNVWKLAEGIGVQSEEYSVDTHRKGSVRQFNVDWDRHGEVHQYDVTVAPIFNRKRVREGDLFIIRDTTKQQRMAVRLKRYTDDLQALVEGQTREINDSKEHLADLLMQMHEGFLTVDEHFRIVFANAIMGRLLKIEHAALVGREIFEFLPPDQRARLKSAFKLTSNAPDKIESQEYDFVHSAGGYLPMKVAIATATGDDDARNHYSLVVTDLHEVKEMQYELETHAQQLERANEELLELDKAKDTLLSNVSHELRTPLSTIEGYVEMFQAGTLGAVEGPQIGALNVMTRNLNRLSVMIHEMIEFSRMEIRGIHLYESVFGLGDLIKESVQSALPAAMHKDIRINALVPDEAIFMWGDRDKLSQVMGIFLSNAIKFSHEQSHVDIAVRRGEESDIVLTISDYGIGIEEENIGRIFQKFYQVDSSMTRHFEGTGIGLSIASSVVEAHNGHIDV
ncbi:MAG: PAS domain S-box protein, partial [Candidatus Hydrogenedentota bacterium]